MKYKGKHSRMRKQDSGHFYKRFLLLPYFSRKIDASALLKFLIKFNIFAVPLYVILLLDVQFQPLMQLTTQLAFFMLRFTGINAELNDYLISVPVSSGSFGAFVSWDSTGWKSLLALAALVFATDFSLRKKLLGLLLLPLVYFINILRIWFMFFVVTINASYFEIAHITIWSWGMIFAILLLWIVWMKKIATKEYSMFGKDRKLKRWNGDKDRAGFR